jgi:N-formylglutamate amidohydrolase
VVDAHSFPCNPLPYEIDQMGARPEICIGTDEFHTPAALLFHLRGAFEAAGFTVATNEPFSGALVPQRYYRRDARVSSVMIEVRRDIYMDECTGQKHDGFEAIGHRINDAMEAGVAGWLETAQSS